MELVRLFLFKFKQCTLIQIIYLQTSHILPYIQKKSENCKRKKNKDFIYLFRYFSNQELLEKVPKIFLILGGIYFCLLFTGLSLLVEKKDNIILQINDSEETHLIKSEKKNSLGVRYENSTEGMGISEACKFAVFWMLFGKIFTQLVPCGLVITYYKTFGQTFIIDDQFLSQVGSIAAFFNAFGTFFWGYIIDRSVYKVK